MPKRVCGRKRVGWWVGTVVAVLAGLVGATMVWSAIGLRLSAETFVEVPPERVWAFFADPHNLPKWDRSVASIEITSSPPYGVGSTFETISPEQGGRVTRTSYRVAELVPGKRATIDVVDPEEFQRATWVTRVEPSGGGTGVLIDVEFRPKLQYFFLTPLLYFSRDNMGITDMRYLNEALAAYGR
ncbi:SRPBCC family protein [Pseudonocardia sp. CA-107938]|uniref:SRPBCC family protein n=1 Tax=Pseudonocardia sp. CA-107938 TaxID=3240021 RepID=UPI003D937395